MSGRVVVILAGLLCALVLVTMAPASAAKSWPNLVVSPHGRAWTAELARPLFPKGLRWVPGDSSSRTFYARNQSGLHARLRVLVHVADATRWLCCGHLRMGVAINGRWRPITIAGSTGVGQLLLAPGDVVPVKVLVRLLRPAGNQAMGRKLRFSVDLRLTELPTRGAA